MDASKFVYLTIILPTYNGWELIKANLNLILPQVINHKDKVRIYISDNASTDNIQKEIGAFTDKYQDVLLYHRRNENIGGPNNFNAAVHEVNSEYIYILGDDDYISPFFVITILKLLEDNPDIGLFHFNYLIGKNGLKDCSLYHNEIVPQQLVRYSNGSEFVKSLMTSPSFISSNLFKREVWLKGARAKVMECPGYSWFVKLLKGCIDYPCIYCQMPLLIQNFPNQNSYSDKWIYYYIVGLGNLFKELDDDIPGIYNHWISLQQSKDEFSFYQYISPVILHKEYYLEREGEILSHISTEFGRRYFKFILRYGNKVNYKLVIRPFLRLLRRLNKNRLL